MVSLLVMGMGLRFLDGWTFETITTWCNTTIALSEPVLAVLEPIPNGYVVDVNRKTR